MRDESQNTLNLILPTYEQLKSSYINEIKDAGINQSEDFLINTIFNPDSELWKGTDMTGDKEISLWPDTPKEMLSLINGINEYSPSLYDIDHSILEEICLPSMVALDIVELNLDSNNNNFNDSSEFMEYLMMEDGYFLVEDLAEDFEERFNSETSIEELKEIILAIERGEL